MKFRFFIAVSIIPLFFECAAAQDSLSSINRYPSGLSFQYGVGGYGLRDNFISNEKYSGIMPYFSLRWSRAHKKYIYKLEGDLMHSKKIKNHNISTEITLARISHGFLYPLRNKKSLTKDFNLWLGPTTIILIYTNLPKIAVAGFNYSQSSAGLFSLGLHMEGNYKISRKLQLESSVGLSVLSLGFHNIDNDISNESMVKPLLFTSALDLPFSLGARYYLLKKLSVQFDYKFEFARITAWEDLLSAGDYVVAGLTYNF